MHAAGDKVQGVDFPESADAINDYPIALAQERPEPRDGARPSSRWCDSAEGQKVLTRAGFLKP